MRSIPHKFFRAAAITGVTSWVVAAVYLIFHLVEMLSVKRGLIDDPSLAFLPYRNVKISKEYRGVAGPRSWTWNGCTFVVWNIASSTETITKATTVNAIRDYREWRDDQKSDRFKKTLAFFAINPEFDKIAGIVEELIGASDCRYQYIHFGTSSTGILDAGIWLCSPKLRMIVLLDSSI